MTTYFAELRFVHSSRRIAARLPRAVNSLPQLKALLWVCLVCLPLLFGATAPAQDAPLPPTSMPSSPASASTSARPTSRNTQSPDTLEAAVPSRFRITGTLIDSMSGAPVPRAEMSVTHLVARRQNTRSQGQTIIAVTDAAGHFDLEVPSAGGWSLSATARGYHTQTFDEHDGYSTAIVLTEANPAYDVTFRLPPASAIEGYVLDEAGEPVRNGQVAISLIPAATPEDQHPRHQPRGRESTDDRGYYKFSGLLAGSYEMRVQAQPWYATNSGPRFDRIGTSRNGAVAGSISLDGSLRAVGVGPSAIASEPDPLDVVYPTLWYPGVADFSAAAPLTLRPGEAREADFRISPIPSVHLRIPAEASAADDTGRPMGQVNTYLTQVLPDGSETGFSSGGHGDAQGNMEFSGLAPGTYIVHRQGETRSNLPSVATIQISANSARSVDLSQAVSATFVTVKIDPAADLPALQINFRDLESGRVSSVPSQQNAGSRGLRRRPSEPDGPQEARPAEPPAGAPRADGSRADGSNDRSISLQPGRYEVTLSGIGDLHLASIEATGAQSAGRTVTIGGGAPSLMLHVAGGHANVTGFVRSKGAPVAGAMVLLVPATLEDPSGLGITRSDQSNTDGSFDILNVRPGAYILVAIDHGWDVNWHEPATLKRFLMHGLPLDLKTPGERSETIEAQAP